MPLQDTRDGRDLLCLLDRSDSTTSRLRAAMKADGWSVESPAVLDAEAELMAREERQTDG